MAERQHIYVIVELDCDISSLQLVLKLYFVVPNYRREFSFAIQDISTVLMSLRSYILNPCLALVVHAQINFVFLYHNLDLSHLLQ